MTEATQMQHFIGTKEVMARPMTRGEYLDYRGWSLPEGENPGDAGYLVEYLDGGPGCDARHAGYISWSPAEVFERANVSLAGPFDFGVALRLLKQGKSVARTGWNGKNQRVFMMYGNKLSEKLGWGYGEYQGEPTITSTLAIHTARNEVQIGWLATQSDMLATDWVLFQ